MIDLFIMISFRVLFLFIIFYILFDNIFDWFILFLGIINKNLLDWTLRW